MIIIITLIKLQFGKKKHELPKVFPTYMWVLEIKVKKGENGILFHAYLTTVLFVTLQ